MTKGNDGTHTVWQLNDKQNSSVNVFQMGSRGGRRNLLKSLVKSTDRGRVRLNLAIMKITNITLNDPNTDIMNAR